MPATWPSGVPTRVLFNGASLPEGETAIRSPTDSGLARQRAQFRGAFDRVTGSISMTRTQYETFGAWRKGLGGGTFNWTGYKAGFTAVCRFVAGEQAPPTGNAQTGKWLVPVAIEVMSVAEDP